MKYAQILKSDMRVNLIGGPEVGLPIEHPQVLCIDIGDRTDVKVFMKYDEHTGEFYEEAHELTPEPPTVDERLSAMEEALLMIL